MRSIGAHGAVDALEPIKEIVANDWRFHNSKRSHSALQKAWVRGLGDVFFRGCRNAAVAHARDQGLTGQVKVMT
jgi:hypothetical protein